VPKFCPPEPDAVVQTVREAAQYDSPDLAMHEREAGRMLLDEGDRGTTGELELSAQPASLTFVPFYS
jgi:hypothetical protein